MARFARVVVPDHPYHVTCRGNRREAVFLGKVGTAKTSSSPTGVSEESFGRPDFHALGCGCGGSGGHGVGKIASTKDYAGNYTFFEYDIMERLKKRTFSGISDYVEYTYDDAGRNSG